MINQYFLPILNKVRTIEDADILTGQIDLILEDLYKTTSISINDLIDHNLSSEIATEIKKAFLDHALSFEHHEEVKSFFTTLKEELSKCKVITLTLAYKPPYDHIKHLKDWCTKNLSDPTIFEFEYEPELIAGAIIVLDGHYLDFSVKTRLTEYFKGKNQNAKVKIAI